MSDRKTLKIAAFAALTLSVVGASFLVSAADGEAELLARAQAMFKPLPETAQTPETESTIAQPLGTWDEHVESWTSLPPSIVQTVRYEDLRADPWSTFSRVREFLGFPEDDERMRRAIEFSSFKKLSSAERESRTRCRPSTKTTSLPISAPPICCAPNCSGWWTWRGF